jgi:hypothetical protein
VTPLDDRHFVALARKVGRPPTAELHRLRQLQLERQARGEKLSMFEVACLEKALAPDDVKRFEVWAGQIARAENVPLEHSDLAPTTPSTRTAAAPPPPPAPMPPMPAAPAPLPTPPPAPQQPTGKKRVLHKSAAAFSTLHSRCCRCGCDLDEFALLEGRASEVEDGSACTACFEKERGASAPASPSKTPSGREAPAPAASKTPSAGAAAAKAPEPSKTPSGRPLLSTPSKRRLQAGQAKPKALPVNQLRLLIAGSVVLVVALLVALVAVATQKPPAPEIAFASPSPVAQPSAAPSAAPSPRDPGERPPAERAARVANEIGALAHDGRYRDALARADEALAKRLDRDSIALVKDARDRAVEAFRHKIAEAKELAQGGAKHSAKKMLARLHLDVPDELEAELKAAEASLDGGEAPTPDASESPEGFDKDPDGFVPPPRRPSPVPSPESPGSTTRPSPRPVEPSPPEPSPPAPSPDPEDDPPLPASWMDDMDGVLPWSQAYVYETENYVIRTSAPKKRIERYGALMEALANRYKSIFRAPGGEATTKAKLLLYGSQVQFHENEPGMETAGGFYKPSTRDLHCFHGPSRGGRNGWAVQALAHEATHQFQHRACSQIFEHSPTFFTEGLASFFEEPKFLPDGYVLVGGISTKYMNTCRRAIRSSDTIPLAQLIRTPHADFDYFHYAHAWALIHWMFYGPDSKKSTKLLDWYWDNCVARVTTADDFEDGVKAMGYTMPKLEKAWRDWVLALDPKKDPAILLYEQKTGKKVPR